jgi:integrase
MASQESEYPGLARLPNKDGTERLYWRCNKRAAALGYEPSTVRLHPETDDELRSQCAILQAEMLDWIARKEGAADTMPRRPTIAALFRFYREQPESPYHRVKFNTRRTYSYVLDEIEAAAGDVELERINLATLHRWYNEARWPEGRGQGAPEHVRKAHGIISMLRRVVAFGVAAEIDGCDRLDRILSKAEFEAPGRREIAMTAEQAQAFVRAAIDHGRASLAIGTAIQFECAMRQKDVIGEWEPIGPAGASSTFVMNGRQWVRGLTWADISDDWRLTKRTTKTGAIVSHDLTLCPMALEQLRAVPEGLRFGPLIIDEKAGRPYARDAYQREWRVVADAAGLPRWLYNMDARAGAATEADEAGAAIDSVRVAMGHSDAKTTARYVRGSGLEQSRKVAELRLAHRRGK